MTAVHRASCREWVETAIRAACEEGVDGLRPGGYETGRRMTHLAAPVVSLVWGAVSAVMSRGWHAS